MRELRTQLAFPWFLHGVIQDAPMNSAKSPAKSKTIHFQILTILSVLVPGVKDWLVQNPEAFLSLLTSANVILRLVTKGPLKMSVGSKASAVGVSLIGWLFMSLAALSLTACGGASFTAGVKDNVTGIEGEFSVKLPPVVIAEK